MAIETNCFSSCLSVRVEQGQRVESRAQTAAWADQSVKYMNIAERKDDATSAVEKCCCEILATLNCFQNLNETKSPKLLIVVHVNEFLVLGGRLTNARPKQAINAWR